MRRPALVFLTIVLIFYGLAFGGKYWNGKDKLNLVINRKEADIVVASFDPRLKELTTITIPGDTQAELSRQLGTWKLKSVWKLAANEKIGGVLLSETITKNFRFPIYTWADSDAYGFINGNIFDLSKSVLSIYKTNLSFWDRVKLGVFVISLSDAKRFDYDLRNFPIIQSTKLLDGSRGYQVTNKRSDKFSLIFSDSEISEKNLKVSIKDATDKPQIAQRVGEIIEVLGAKIFDISKEEPGAFDCQVSGKEVSVVKKLATLFSCKQSKDKMEGNFDIELRIGEDFAKRY